MSVNVTSKEMEEILDAQLATIKARIMEANAKKVTWDFTTYGKDYEVFIFQINWRTQGNP